MFNGEPEPVSDEDILAEIQTLRLKPPRGG